MPRHRSDASPFSLRLTQAERSTLEKAALAAYPVRWEGQRPSSLGPYIVRAALAVARGDVEELKRLKFNSLKPVE